MSSAPLLLGEGLHGDAEVSPILPQTVIRLSSPMHNRNIGLPTIEEELLQALSEVGAIKKDFNLGQLRFQRCSRTDKGVSAARQVVSLKMSGWRGHEGGVGDAVSFLLSLDLTHASHVCIGGED